MDLNSVSLTARLTRDPEGRTTPSGTSVCRMRIAVNGFTGNGEPKADYLDLVVFGRQAESCGQYLHKGSRVCVAGHLANNEWTDSEGAKHSRVEVIGRQVGFLDPAQRGQDQTSEPARQGQKAPEHEPSSTREQSSQAAPAVA